ncbi:MAG: branched-chain amino acid transport system substrate-binding protein [Actinomycetota bacterium]|jgi:branched-chain amino acid transport system substrate-binding protein|nr:branched-chain amino acid transport system substrate-binding protein [Actinomycetota bacterium]
MHDHTWIWAVVGGLVLAGLLLFHILSGMLKALPTEVRAPITASAKANSRPLAVLAVIVLWTATYALYSVAHLSDDTSSLANAAQTGSGATTGPGTTGTAPVTPGSTAPVPGGTVTGAVTGPATTSTGGTRTSPITDNSNPTVANSTVFGGQKTKPAQSYRDSTIYKAGAANIRGITSDTVTVCGHAPLTLGYAINTKPEDELVFWNYLNANGGIYGRKFNVTLEDDQYTATGGVPAAQKCAAKNPFMIFGALGSDVIPPVRQWAEQNKELYLYGFTVRAGSEKYRYSFTNTISSEDLSSVIADLSADKLPGKKVGIVWRNSSNFQPAHDQFIREVRKRGGEVVADVPVQQNQGSYNQEILTLQQKGAESVYVLEDAFTQLAIIRQGKSQQYNPHWLVFGFNVQTKGLGNDALNPPLLGSNLAPPYECRKYDGPYASYGAEIKVFEAAYAKYSPNTDLCGIAGDVAWQSWVEFKNMAGLFVACGRDCTRDRFAGIMESGYTGTTGAACPVNFSGDGHHGGFRADLFEAYAVSNGNAGWRPIRRCVQAI